MSESRNRATIDALVAAINGRDLADPAAERTGARSTAGSRRCPASRRGGVGQRR